jgi:hypothetical protein
MQGLVVFFPYASIKKGLSTLVIEAKKFLKPLNCCGIMHVPLNKGREFNEVSKAFHHLIQYMPFKCSQIHLL